MNWFMITGKKNGHSKRGGICRFKWINHTDSARHTTTRIFGSVLCETKWLLLFLTVNTETKPQNKTVERITIDPHVSHAQSHLNGWLFPPEEPVQTFKSTDNARFSPLTLSFFPSLKLPCCNLMWYQLKPGGLARREPGLAPRPGPHHCFWLLLFFSAFPPVYPLWVTELLDQACLPHLLIPGPPCHTQWWKMTFPHLRHPLVPPTPLPTSLSIPNPISKAWVFLIYWWPHTLTLSLQLCRTAHWQD